MFGLATSADNAIGLKQHLRSNRQPHRLRRLQIDDELELRVHLHRNVGGFCPLENFVHQTRGLLTRFICVRGIASAAS